MIDLQKQRESTHIFGHYSVRNNYYSITIWLLITTAVSSSLPILEPFTPPNCTKGPASNFNQIGILNCQQSELYVIEIGMGSPPQQMFVQVDTSTNALWVQTSAVNSLYGFNPGKSKTYKNSSNQYTEKFVNGCSVRGWIGSDLVSVGNTIKVTMSIGFVDQISGVQLPNGVVGMMGLGYTNPSAQPNFLDLAQQEKIIASNSFTLELSKNNSASVMLYNSIPQSIVTNSLESSVKAGSQAWLIQVLGVIAGLTDLTAESAYTALMDSRSQYIYLNTALFQKFSALFLPTNQCNSTKGISTCNCSIMESLPNLTLIFQGVAVNLQPSDYVECVNCTCQVYIGEDTASNEIVLGEIFFNQYNVTFSKANGSIGLMGSITSVFGFGNQGFFISSQWAMMIIQSALAILAFLGFLVFLIIDLRNQSNKNTGVVDVIEMYEDSAKSAPPSMSKTKKRPLIRQRETYMEEEAELQ